MRFLYLFLFSLLFSFSSYAQNYAYESVENDPTQTRIYTLENGLKVYLSQNTDEPRVYTNVSVRAGSKYDPADATGLAHYLEHMLFKGNSQIAAKDWAKEKVYLKQISDLYEKHKQTSSEVEKKKIYLQIDSLSGIAAKLAIANEYDKMVSSIGASGTNAYTSKERTVYINEIPSNELEKWLLLESTRFKELSLRIFHTELEAVYEEYNRSRDNDISKLFEKTHELLFVNHPYGTQTTIGTSEHLKNPSMVKIHEYFDAYYVPNNMAVMISGDIDFENTIKLVDQYFGSFAKKQVPEFSFEAEPEITSPKSASLKGPNFEVVMLAYRFDGASSKDEPYLNLIDYMLSNSSAGLIDLNLNQQQKVLQAGSFSSIDQDYSTLYLYGLAKQGQSLKEVRELLLEQFKLLKTGDFDAQMMQACIKNMLLDNEKAIESNRSRCSMMTESFILEKPWDQVIFDYKTLEKITKENLVKFAQNNFNENYVYVEKFTGKDSGLAKVDKPQITPIEITRDEQSEFAKKFYAKQPEKILPVFVDFEKAIKKEKLASSTLNYIENTSNKTFSFSVIFDIGSKHIDTLELLGSYLSYLGTDNYSAAEFKKALFKLGIEMNFSFASEQSYITLSGLESSFEQGMALFYEFFTNLKPNQDAYNEMIKDILKSRDDAKLDKGTILRSALRSYAVYGKHNPFKDKFSEAELKNIDAKQLTELAKDIFKYKKNYFFYGSTSALEVRSIVRNLIPSINASEDYPEMKSYAFLQPEKTQVLFTHFDMVQTELMAISNVGDFHKDQIALAAMHNNYFGSGLSSIVFQEIRESKALAYSASNRFSTPSKKQDPCFVTTYIGSQADKLGLAVDAMNELLAEMPQSPGQFEDAKQSALKQIATNRITKASIFWQHQKNKRLGFNEDYREEVYQAIEKMTIDQLNNFFSTHMQKTPTYLVIGDREKVDFESLKKLGEIKELSLEEIFGY